MRAMLFAFILFLPVAAHATTAQELAARMGIITDADLAPLRDAERDWTIQLVRSQCTPTLDRST